MWYSYNEWLYARHVVRARWRVSDKGCTMAHRCLGKYGLEVDRDADKSFEILHMPVFCTDLAKYFWIFIDNVYLKLYLWLTEGKGTLQILEELSREFWVIVEMHEKPQKLNFYHFSTDQVLRPPRFCWELSQHDSIPLFLWYSSLSLKINLKQQCQFSDFFHLCKDLL